MRISSLKGKNILIWGFGAEGKSALLQLSKRVSANWRIFNDEPLAAIDQELIESVPGAKNFSTIDFSSALDGVNCLIKSPGISLYSDEAKLVKQKKIPITSGSSIWFSERGNTENTIVVTGTKGKSTTASLLNHLLKNASFSTVLCGNIGVPLLDHLDSESVDYWIIELSSYQLADLDGKIQTGLLLNLMPEHLNWHQTLEQYYQDKCRIAQCLSKEDSILLTSQKVMDTFKLPENNLIYLYDSNQDISIGADKSIIVAGQEYQLLSRTFPGKHSITNLQAALVVLSQLGIEIHNLNEALNSFEPLPHRFSTVARKNNITFIDDSISTIPASSVAAIDSLSGNSCILILGGFNRGINWQEYAEKLLQPGVKLIVCTGANGDYIYSVLKDFTASATFTVKTDVKLTKEFDAAVKIALENAVSKDYVLLSPGSASYDQFKNYQERGKRFKELVNCYQFIKITD